MEQKTFSRFRLQNKRRIIEKILKMEWMWFTIHMLQFVELFILCHDMEPAPHATD